MKNPIKKWRERREQKRKQRETQQTMQLWAWLEKIFESGQLSFDYEHNRLFITQPMAVLMMTHGADGWVQSVHNIYEYVHWMLTRRTWEEYMHQEELAAVRNVLNEGKELTRTDIERIKHTRRQEIAFSDMVPPKVEPFEFFIIPNSTGAAVEPFAVGSYDPDTGKMEVATWEEVRTLLSQKE